MFACKLRLPLASCLVLLLSVSALATVIHVPADQPTIQAAINAAVSGDTVLVSSGTYYENITFLGKAITVTSASGPLTTIIDGSKGSYTATVTFSSNEKATAVLSGFTLKNGDGEVSITNASPTVRGNVIVAGQAAYYQTLGIAIGYGASATVQGNLIAGGTFQGIQSYSGKGSKIIGNLIADNASAGISSSYDTGANTIQQNTIIGNAGGGIGFYSFGTHGLTVVQNLIEANGNTGLNIAANGAPVTLISNTVVDNQGGYNGYPSEVGLDQFNTAVTIQNNLIVATGNSPAFSCQYNNGVPVFTNNDVFAASNSSYTGSCPDPTGTNGNISADPLFVDLLSDDYLIQPGSPAANAGINSAPGEPTTDFVGNPRVLDGTIDMGADESLTVPALGLTPYALRFAAQDVGTTSAPESVTLTNNSTKAVAINLIATGPSYSQTNNCATSLAAGASCQISVAFTPSRGAAIPGVVGIFTGATLNPLAVDLLGTGLAPQVQFNSNFYFYNQVIGTSVTQTGTLTNVGQAPLAISSIVLNGATDFVETSTCPIAPATLAVQASCTISVTYTPTIIGNESGTITITDDAGSGVQANYVSGSSVSAGIPTLTPMLLTFPTTLIGQTSAAQTVTLANTGTGPLGIQNIYSYNDFVQTNNCPTSLAVGASCTISVIYTPSSQGMEYGYLFVYTDSGNYNNTVSMTGTGQAPVPTVASLSLTSVPAGSSDTQLTITGTGFVNGSQLVWNGVALPGYLYTNGTTQVVVNIPAGDLTKAGTYQVAIFTPTPGGGTSNSLPFTVYAPINYAVTSTPYSYRNIVGTNLDLYYYQLAQITSPFSIQFGGGSYTLLTVGAGGTISFNGFASEYNDVIPTTQTPMLVAPFWTALAPFGTGTDNNVFWDVTGSAPNRELIVEWRDVPICCTYSSQETVKFQVVFFEGSSNILFNYADTIFGGQSAGSDNGATATSGVQVAPGLGTQYSYDQPSLLSNTALLWYPSSPTATLSSGNLAFGYHQIGTKTLARKVTLTNGGHIPLAITAITTGNPDFTQLNNCGVSLNAGKSCSIRVFFTPSEPFSETDTLTISDNATNSPQTASLTGIGTITPIVVYPIMANFGSVKVGSTGTLPVVLANGSNRPLSIQQIVAAPSIYTQTNNCGTSLVAGASCTVNVTFTPVQQGNVSGKISMGLNGKPMVVEVKLVGSGQ